MLFSLFTFWIYLLILKGQYLFTLERKQTNLSKSVPTEKTKNNNVGTLNLKKISNFIHSEYKYNFFGGKVEVINFWKYSSHCTAHNIDFNDNKKVYSVCKFSHWSVTFDFVKLN